jgi:hypothetical protein
MISRASRSRIELNPTRRGDGWVHTSPPTPQLISKPTPTEASNAIVKKSLAGRIRGTLQAASSFIEKPLVVITFLLIVYADIVLESVSLSSNGVSSAAVDGLHGMILNLQCIELLLQMILFRVRFFSHWGYCFDTILVGTKVFNGHYFDVKPHHLHISSFLRVWRFVHVVQSYLAIEISRHARTKEEKNNVERERSLLMEEIDTLREALKLAALEVAAMKGQT